MLDLAAFHQKDNILSGKSNLLRTAWKKIARATEHLGSLEEAINLTQNENFWFEFEIDADGQPWAVLKFDEMPDQVSLICGEFAHQARSALDVAFVQIAQGTGSKKEKLAFPFAAKASFLISPKQKQCKHLEEVPVGIRNIIIEFAPHEEGGGNRNLVSLNEICNLDKHNDFIETTTNGLNFTGIAHDRLRSDLERFVVPTMLGSMAASAAVREDHIYRGGSRFKIPEPVLALCTPDEAVRMTGRATKLPYNVVFSNTETLDGHNVMQSCTAMRDEVVILLERFDKAL